MPAAAHAREARQASTSSTLSTKLILHYFWYRLSDIQHGFGYCFIPTLRFSTITRAHDINDLLAEVLFRTRPTSKAKTGCHAHQSCPSSDFQSSQNLPKIQNTPLNHRLVKTPTSFNHQPCIAQKNGCWGGGLNKCDRVLGGRCSTEVREGQLTNSTTETADG